MTPGGRLYVMAVTVANIRHQPQSRKRVRAPFFVLILALARRTLVFTYVNIILCRALACPFYNLVVVENLQTGSMSAIGTDEPARCVPAGQTGQAAGRWARTRHEVDRTRYI